MQKGQPILVLRPNDHHQLITKIRKDNVVMDIFIGSNGTHFGTDRRANSYFLPDDGTTFGLKAVVTNAAGVNETWLIGEICRLGGVIFFTAKNPPVLVSPQGPKSPATSA